MLLRRLSFLPALLPIAALSACATTTSLPPTEVLRYHLGEPIDRGTISVQPLGVENAPASLEFKTYAAAVETQLLRNGYALAKPGAKPQLIATVGFTRADVEGPARRSPVSIGLGGGSFGGGRGGGVGLGGGVNFPIGGGGPRTMIATELAVTIKRSVDQSPVWEGRAHSVSDPRKAASDVGAEANTLAAALFTGFPGESGRTIQVK
ncbi:DUF4136 domain-containing protein [Sphingomonas sp. S-NIH.Pt15_0812]|uniref:DUF4136 domain-containing protein n=1 Tax=Sphingomonas sp. S-NIH.Pt15_0812 TaxID=1920129 RepID=UPI000F7E7666|nr:DUF4136 domain-containing protein [Sphingomonas sp. S-NIH.Pt15_0812]RSU53157.1 hypothetical protein BRX43_04615 [Sphingomonas sp. S-NIH.Pt15_0812]